MSEFSDPSSFRTAFAATGARYKRILVEETVPGMVYRFTCVAGRVVSIEFMRPSNVEGDGTHTLAELIKTKNAERRLNPAHAGFLLRLGEREREFLNKAGFRPEHVPEAGELVFLSGLSNLHQGADCIDATDTVHQSYVELVEQALERLPGLILCGFDIAIQDISQPATLKNYHILELNCCPGFSTCHYPWRGQPRDVAGAILDYLATSAPRHAQASHRGDDAPNRFAKGSNGDCLVKALDARSIPHHYLWPDEITAARWLGHTVVAFHVGGVPYYFAGSHLRISDPSGTEVPGPIIDLRAARFVRHKDQVKSLLRIHGFNVPEGAVFSHADRHNAKSYFALLCPSEPYGVCVKPVNGHRGYRVYVGIRDLTSFRRAFSAVGETLQGGLG